MKTVKLMAQLNQIKGITVTEYNGSPISEPIKNSAQVSALDLHFKTIVTRGDAKMSSFIAVKPQHPQSPSIFSIKLECPNLLDERSASKFSLEIEKEVNVFWKDHANSRGLTTLSHQLFTAIVYFDIVLECLDGEAFPSSKQLDSTFRLSAISQSSTQRPLAVMASTGWTDNAEGASTAENSLPSVDLIPLTFFSGDSFVSYSLEMFPYEVNPLSDEENKRLLELFKGQKDGFCQVGPQKWLLPISYKNHAETFYNMELREDDVLIVALPRTGTTMMQELIWMVNNNLDFERSASIPLAERFTFLDLDVLIHDELGDELRSLNTNTSFLRLLDACKSPASEVVARSPSPGHFKTHLPFSLLPPDILDKSKVIYLARNPKDVVVSYYFLNKLFRCTDYGGDFKTFWDLFKKDLVLYAPYWKHTEEGWERKDHPNMLFLFYEDIVKDMKGAIRKVSKFLNKPMTEENVEKLYDHLQIENFPKKVIIFGDNGEIQGWTNPTDEGFIRKGDSRSKKEVTDEIQREMHDWIQEHVSQNQIVFP